MGTDIGVESGPLDNLIYFQLNLNKPLKDHIKGQRSVRNLKILLSWERREYINRVEK